jgi:hypothetical protein
MEDDDITWMGIMFLLLRCLGAIALIGIPIWVVYKFLKWLFD